MPERTLRVCALYPELMNIYADRGNMLLLERRCAWRGIGFELAAAGIGDEIDPGAHDLFYIGGGQDRDQLLCARDLVEVKRDALPLRPRAARVILGVCGGYQLLGHSYVIGDEEIAAASACVDLRTVRDDGPAADRQRRDRGGASPARRAARARGLREPRRAHAPRAGGQPLGRVLRGHGNDGAVGLEGGRDGNVIGTYLHGPLLPKNAWFADWLVADGARSRGSARGARRPARGRGPRGRAPRGRPRRHVGRG